MFRELPDPLQHIRLQWYRYMLEYRTEFVSACVRYPFVHQSIKYLLRSESVV